MNHFIRCTLLTGALCMSTYTANADTFAEDLSLMRQHFSPTVLHRGERRLAVMGELQGRVMVSSMSGDEGQSIGWINRTYLSEGELTPNRPMAAPTG